MNRLYPLLLSLLAGAQVFFIWISTQVVFPKAISALPREDPLRRNAADTVGGMLLRLDKASLSIGAICALWAILQGHRLQAALPAAVALSAALSVLWITPEIHALREAGNTASGRFGMLHGLSSGLLLLEIVLLCIAAWRASRA